MAYGDNRSEVASDTFDSSISASWDNGYGDYETLSWVTGGHVEPSAAFGEPGMRRNTGTYADDQYSRITINAFSSSASEIWAMARCASGATDESCYAAVNTANGSQHAINEINSSLGITTLTSSNTDPDNPGSGDILTCECEGTTIRSGDTMNGGDAQRLTTTDATLTGGRPGLLAFTAGATSATRITAWSGGDISADLNVSVGVATLEVATFAATVANDRNVSVGVEALSVQTFAATVSNDRNVSVQSEGLVLQTFAASITSDREAVTGTAGLSLQTFQASISSNSDLEVSVGVASLSLQTFPASITNNREVSVGVEALSLQTFAATITSDRDVAAGLASMNLQTFAASITSDREVLVGAEALQLQTFAATISSPVVGGGSSQIRPIRGIHGGHMGRK